MQLTYQSGGEVTYSYTGEIKNSYKIRCSVSNSYGRTYSETAEIGISYPMNSNEADLAGQFLMYVEDCFNISGRGTVLTGRVASDELKLNDEVNIITPQGKIIPAKVTGIEMFKKLMDSKACKITFTAPAEPPAEEKIIYGDVDLNGTVSVSDARLALRGAIKLTDAGIDLVNASSKNFKAADVQKDGKITVSDARLILRKSIGFNDAEFPK